MRPLTVNGLEALRFISERDVPTSAMRWCTLEALHRRGFIEPCEFESTHVPSRWRITDEGRQYLRAEQPTSPKPDITVRWGKRDDSGRLDGEGALVYRGPSPTCGLLAYVFESLAVHDSTLAKLLIENGYDLKTLRFSIRKK